ncbi:MAG: hypothetical protein QW212_00695 [Nitrososphaerales archaeon]
MGTSIVVAWDLEGEHSWPSAPDCYDFLRNPHHHIFHFEVAIPILTSRQLEFLEVRRMLMGALLDRFGPEVCRFGPRSCEDLVEDLKEIAKSIYVQPDRVAVYEDNFVGAEWRR